MKLARYYGSFIQENESRILDLLGLKSHLHHLDLNLFTLRTIYCRKVSLNMSLRAPPAFAVLNIFLSLDTAFASPDLIR